MIHRLSLNALWLALGAHVRTGLEKNLYLDKEKTQPAINERLVSHLAKVAGVVGRPIATIGQTRKLLGLR
jgi:3-oxoadipate:acetyl-CoA acetyltransferase